MLRINANKVALLAAAFFITKYNEMLSSFGRYTLDYSLSILGVDAVVAMEAKWDAAKGLITEFKFDIESEELNVDIVLDGSVDDASALALDAINRYVTIDSAYLLVV